METIPEIYLNNGTLHLHRTICIHQNEGLIVWKNWMCDISVLGYLGQRMPCNILKQEICGTDECSLKRNFVNES